VCSINGVGCPANNCFCDPSRFWNYEYWDGSQWVGYSVGAAGSTLYDGAIEGWRWSEWGVGSLPPAGQLLAAGSALDWLAEQQSADDGGYGGVGSSVEVLMAIGSNGINPISWRRSAEAPSLLDYLMVRSVAFSQSGAASAGKLAVGISGTDGCLTYQSKKPMDYYDPASGMFSQDAGFQTWAMLGTSALSQTVPADAVLYLKSMQQSDGGWEWTPGGFGGGTDTNTTALAVQALVAAGESASSPEIEAALDYLEAAQNDDGGFPYDADSPYGTDSDANSTAYVIQALIAAGEDLTTWAPAGSDPMDFLLSLQLPSGAFEWQAGFGEDLIATRQAISALMGRPFPLEAQPVDTCPIWFFPVIGR
jgi:hypothetical protein